MDREAYEAETNRILREAAEIASRQLAEAERRQRRPLGRFVRAWSVLTGTDQGSGYRPR